MTLLVFGSLISLAITFLLNQLAKPDTLPNVAFVKFLTLAGIGILDNMKQPLFKTSKFFSTIIFKSAFQHSVLSFNSLMSCGLAFCQCSTFL